jgi:hypothetical protein
MSRKLTLWSAFAVGIAAGAVAGCQTYDFEPVQPLAVAQTTAAKSIAGRNNKPNLLLLVDKSGSMDQPINPSLAACQSGGSVCGPSTTPCNVNTCPTRWSELKTAMNNFLTNSGTVGRMGLVFFPKASPCTAPSLADVAVQIPNSKDVEAELQAAAEQINNQIQTVAVGGGTPTGNALKAMADYAPLLADDSRQDFVLVLTDGLPNCNESNPNDYSVDANSCRCTLEGGVCVSPFQKLGCLDKDGTVAQVRALKTKNISTIVIGFGAETASGDGPDVLNAMAEAGGFARACPESTDAECGSNNICNKTTKLCEKKFYQAANGDELARALADISKKIGVDPCEFLLTQQPSDPRFLSVVVDGQSVPRGDNTWSYDGGKIKFLGSLCTKLSSSTDLNPVEVEVRVVETL